MIVDEACCISHWGADFHKKYGTLGIIHIFLPHGTSVIAMTVTLITWEIGQCWQNTILLVTFLPQISTLVDSLDSSYRQKKPQYCP